MKPLFYTLLLLFGFSTALPAQQMTASKDKMSSEKKYESITDAQIEVDMRAQAIRTLNLTTEETEDFTPIFLEYQKYQDKLEARLDRVVTEYQEEMEEDNSEKSAANERADFIEDYWEVKIADQELKKDYFDRLEDVIGADRALKFFSMEDMYRSRAIRARIAEYMPAIILVEPVNLSYQAELDAFNDWNRINIDGTVALDHEFTSQGLKKLVKLADAMAAAEGIEVNNIEQRKSMIMQKANSITQNWRSLDHANDTRTAFVATADILEQIAKDERFITRKAWLKNLEEAATAIDVNVKLTDQPNHVYKFFSTAETIVNDLISQANGSTNYSNYNMRK